ncbi:hypothetical protein QP400_06425 [Winkia sp. UMB3158]|uniref:Uncharacterized protein n=3 Tax=Actinomycetaceae TaxID=2049 RepID=A0AB38XQ78_9ACTO|nr:MULTISPECIES: hypothetical protein [Winkia]MDK8340974.1 hypothetical protein [Winkia sp. UMB3164B]KWZ75462.1 hypothetical protein HMPREF3198_00073 [Winkia neuii]MDK7149759.1 hypothetical protein [Winkia sp. UMB3158]MDK7163480.1 hypothetical protein [Winkia sp. UMB3105]MDK7229628.1 hypothetical protein [Winkia sp. UMB1185]
MHITELAINGLSLLIATGGLIVAVLARRDTKISQRAAKEANRLAKDANIAATRANRLAGEANQISSKANKIATRALATTQDVSHYSWAIQIDHDAGLLVLTNESPFSATNISITIRHEKDTIYQGGAGAIGPFGKVGLGTSLLVDDVRDRLASKDTALGGGIFGVAQISCDVFLSWDSQVGVPRSDHFEHCFTKADCH